MSMGFPLGRIVSTPGALEAMEEAGIDPADLLMRHQSCDFGDIDAHDRRENARSIENGWRIVSAYEVDQRSYGFGLKVWIITEADRSVTTLLLPEEY